MTANAYAEGGFSVSGTGNPFPLAGGTVWAASVVPGVSGTSPNLQVFVDVLVGGTWTQVLALTAQTAAGYVQGQAPMPDGASPVGRIRWTVSGTAPMFYGQAFALAC